MRRHAGAYICLNLLLLITASLPSLGTPTPLLSFPSLLLTPERAAHLRALSDLPWKGPSIMRRRDERYQQFVQPQSFADLMAVYDPANEDQLEIAYASYTPEGTPGDDGGFGLHVVKRLRLPVEGGGTRIIDVNEEWPTDRVSGGLFLPDRIRVKSQVFDGQRNQPGSDRLYLFDMIHLHWDEALTPHVLRRSAHDEGAQRVAVSAPASCRGCHQQRRVYESFARDFLASNERPDYESIVSESHFRLPPNKMRGLAQYLAHLRSSEGISQTFVDSVSQTLKSPREATQVPGLREALQRSITSYNWVSTDSPWKGLRGYSTEGSIPLQQGTYEVNGEWYVDAVDSYTEGKYRYWFPAVIIPFSR